MIPNLAQSTTNLAISLFQGADAESFELESPIIVGFSFSGSNSKSIPVYGSGFSKISLKYFSPFAYLGKKEVGFKLFLFSIV